MIRKILNIHHQSYLRIIKSSKVVEKLKKYIFMILIFFFDLLIRFDILVITSIKIKIFETYYLIC